MCALQADPKRVKKALPKILKGLKPEDRVMIIGATRRPFGMGCPIAPQSFACICHLTYVSLNMQMQRQSPSVACTRELSCCPDQTMDLE